MSGLQNFDPYFRMIPNGISEKTKKELLVLAKEPDAFVDNSYKISFFRHPDKLQKYAPYGVAQLLKITEGDGTIHKDRNRYNEYDGTYMPRKSVINYPLTDNPADTVWYDDDKNEVARTVYGNHAAILHVGECYHGVDYNGKEPRIVFQLCFAEGLNDTWNLWNEELYSLSI